MTCASWPRVKLGAYVDLLSGFSFKSAGFTADPSDVPLVKGENVHQGFIDWHKARRWPRDQTDGIDKYWLRSGDVILAMDRPWIEAGLKQACISHRDPPSLLVQRVSRLRGINGLITEYLRHLIASAAFTDYIKPIVTGVSVPHISGTQIKGFEFPLPPLPVQRRIASILSAYDDLIENNTRRIAILEEMARRIYEEWFAHFRFPGHEGVKMVESELGLVPEGWEVLPLAGVADITMGLSPKGDTYNEDGRGVPLVNGPVEFGERFTKRVKWTTAPTKLCGDGDLVVCVRGSTTGKYVKSDGIYCLGRGVCGISSKYQCFVDQLFAHQLPTLLGQTGGSTFPSWTGPQLKSHPVLVPNSKLLVRFENEIGPMRAVVRVYSRQIQNLRTTRDLLLPKLISGELDVSALPEPEALAA